MKLEKKNIIVDEKDTDGKKYKYNVYGKREKETEKKCKSEKESQERKIHRY